MHRRWSVVIVAALLGGLAGCAGDSSAGRSRWSGGNTPPGEPWGEGFAGMFDTSTTDVQVMQACHDLYDGKMPITRINAARRLGELRPTSNLDSAADCVRLFKEARGGLCA